MTVTERLMGAGSWDLTLRPDTPRAALDLINSRLKSFGHIVITPTRIDPDAIGDAATLSLAKYTGVYQKQTSDFRLGGCGLALWLADQDNKGDLLDTAVTNTAGTLATWVTALRPASLLAGTVTSPGGTLTQTYYLTDRRTALNSVCTSFGTEWRINPNFTLDVGTRAVLYPATPTTVIVRTEGDSGRDLNIRGVQGSIAKERDVEDYTTKVYLTTQAANGDTDVTASSTAATTYYDGQGASLVMERIVQQNNTDAAAAVAAAAAELAKYSTIRSAITLTADEYDLSGDVAVGDPIWVYDSLSDLVDLTNQQYYRGSTIYPVLTRLLGYTWPIREGYGVYFRHKVSGVTTWTDLTPYIEFETGDTRVEIGATPRPTSNKVTVPQNVKIRSAWTPAINGGITIGNGTIAGEFVVSDGMCHWTVQVTFGSTTSVTGAVSFVLPLPRSHTIARFDGLGRVSDASVATARNALVAVYSATQDLVFARALDASGTYANEVELSSTIPITWAVSDVLALSGSYPI